MYHHSFHKLAPGLLSISLLLCSCARSTPGSPTATTSANPTEPPTPTDIAPTATTVMATVKQPPACTFPLAQITKVESIPETYTFSETKVVLIAPKGNDYHIIDWLPDSQQVLITEDLRSQYVERNDSEPQQSITLFNPGTGMTKVYATRVESQEPPRWQPGLNGVVYTAAEYTSIDKLHAAYKFTQQIWVSYGNPAAAQMLADNLSQELLAVKPDGSATLFLTNKRVSQLDATLKASTSVSFDPTEWDYATARRSQYPVWFEMAWQPGTSLVFLYSSGGMGGGGYTFILNTESGQVCELNLGGWADQVVRWSSDGRYLAFIRSTKYYFPTFSADLSVLDTTTGKLTVLSVIPPEVEGGHYVDNFVWAPDDRHLLALVEIYISPYNDPHGLYLVDFVTGQSDEVVPGYDSNVNSSQTIAWSPDGLKLALLCPAPGVARICMVDVKKKTR